MAAITAAFVRVPASAEEARRMVRELATGAERADLIKVVQDRGGQGAGGRRKDLEPIKPAILNAIVAEAHQHHLKVFAHWGTTQDLRELVSAGVDGLDHLEPRGVGSGWDQRLLRTVIDRDIPLAPTLAVTDVALTRGQMDMLRDRTRKFHRAGGRLITASDAGMPSVYARDGLVRELELLVSAGLTPREALKAATSTAAAAMRADDIGSIEPGKAADLLVVKGDPLTDITAVRAVAMVYRDGRLVVDNRRAS